ncbi:MAG: type II secretion system F family protein [Bdellovibrionales bacterium]|nr:type II secretion system F family protein [Bdellovibrionales bacterium]
MDKVHIFVIFASIVGVAGFGALAYVLLGGAGAKQQSGMRGLMAAGGARPEHQGRLSRTDGQDPYELSVEEIKKRTGNSNLKSKTEDVSTKLFKAGFFTAADRQRFLRFRIVSFAVSVVALPVVLFGVTNNVLFGFLAIVLGAIIGFTLPMSWLERQIRKREEDIMYFLPLVIEQVSIGVSSALDVGPCINNIVEMATERDSHNPVTEMFVHVEKLIRSGLNLEDALIEVGEANGMTEVKHAFMFLAQCAKHGGEVSKQLQELADSVMMQRQVIIEGKITALPVKATGPLAMVFAGFFALLFAGLLVRLLSAFGG